jgi:hypothetical protein
MCCQNDGCFKTSKKTSRAEDTIEHFSFRQIVKTAKYVIKKCYLLPSICCSGNRYLLFLASTVQQVNTVT